MAFQPGSTGGKVSKAPLAGGTLSSGLETHHDQILMGGDQRPPKASLGILKDSGEEEKNHFLERKKNPKTASHWKVLAGIPVWLLRKTRNRIPASFSEILQGNQRGPIESLRWVCGPPPWLLFSMIDAPSLWVTWVLFPPCGIGEGALAGPDHRPLRCPPGSCSSICLRAVVNSGTTSHSCLGFSLLDPAGLIPGAGWVWEEDEDSWDSLAGGLLAWSRAQILSRPYHSLPCP